MAVRGKKYSRVGLTESGRIDWDNWLNCVVAFWAERRFHGRFIAEQTGLTVGQVYARCRRYGISLRDARDGSGADSEALIGQYGLRNIGTVGQRQIAKKYPDPTEYEEE